VTAAAGGGVTTRDLVAAHDAMHRDVKMGTDCQVHTHEGWVPINAHHVWPLGMGGPDIAANKVNLCMNGHGQVHAYMDHLIRYGEDIPNDIRWHFGPKVRSYAMFGWTQAGKPRRGTS
jgi:hypothetical protein